MQGHIGLNEVAIGISVPLYWGRLMAQVVGDKQAEHLCKNAALLSPSEALKVAHLQAAPTKHSAEHVTHAHLWNLTLHWCTPVLARMCLKIGLSCLQVGLVDRVVSSEQLMPAAEAAIVKALKQPDSGRVVVKERFRGDFSREWEAYPAKEVPGAWEMLAATPTVKALEATLQRLSGKKGKAKL